MRKRPYRLIPALLASLESQEVAREAQAHLVRARELELTSDWEGSPKELDFASLVVAARRAWPDGASVEVGVFRGGTSAILMLASRPGSFHVAIDPYGLPGQSYPVPEYEDWATFRGTARRLFELGDDCGITFCHYLMDSLTFVAGDLLQHPGTFNIIHLDGDHSYEVVKAELAYFRGKLGSPALYLLDDDDDNYPGVGKAAREIPALVEVLHRTYDFPPYGLCGFSAWLDVGRAQARGRGGIWRRGTRTEAPTD